MVKLIKNLEQEINAYEIYLNSDLSYHYKRNRDLISKIITTFYNIQESNKIDEENIVTIKKGLCHSWEVVFYHCTGVLITEFAPYFPVLEEILYELSISKKWIVRRNIIIISLLIKNDDLKNSIILMGMTDVSKKCRDFAYNQIIHIDKTIAIDCVSKILKEKPDHDSKKTLNEILDILNKGYTIWKEYGNNLVIKNKYKIWSISKENFSKMTEDEIINNGSDA